MGPGRWGSRGDIKLGVPVTYSDISNTSLLIEIASRSEGLRAGTLLRHALLPGPGRVVDPLPAALPRRGRRRAEPGVPARGAANQFEALVPEYAHLADAIRVIDIAAATGGPLLKVAMNAEEDEALGYLGMREPVASSQ